MASKEAGYRAAMIYTLVENCRLFEIHVKAYLKELLNRLPGVTAPKKLQR